MKYQGFFLMLFYFFNVWNVYLDHPLCFLNSFKPKLMVQNKRLFMDTYFPTVGICCSDAKSCPTLLWPHGLQHAKLPFPSLSPYRSTPPQKPPAMTAKRKNGANMHTHTHLGNVPGCKERDVGLEREPAQQSRKGSNLSKSRWCKSVSRLDSWKDKGVRGDGCLWKQGEAEKRRDVWKCV